MLSGLIRILSKIEWWLIKPDDVRATCKHFCPNCAWYEICKEDNNDDYTQEDFDWYADADYDYPME